MIPFHKVLGLLELVKGVDYVRDDVQRSPSYILGNVRTELERWIKSYDAATPRKCGRCGAHLKKREGHRLTIPGGALVAICDPCGVSFARWLGSEGNS